MYLLHKRLDHPHKHVLEKILKSLNITTSVSALPLYIACQQGKLHQFHFPHSSQKTTSPLQLMHSYVWGPSPYPSLDGYHYYIYFMDDFNNFTWIYPMHQKSKGINIVSHFIRMAERKLSTKLQWFQTDKGGGYRKLDPLLESLGIEF